jgi:hypothetical protein
MANTVTFTPADTSVAALVVTPIPGTLTVGEGSEDRGGGNYPQGRAALGASGSVEALMDSTALTLALIQTLHDNCCTDLAGDASPVGAGAVSVTGQGDYTAAVSYLALISAEVSGDSAMRVKISWAGSAVTP